MLLLFRLFLFFTLKNVPLFCPDFKMQHVTIQFLSIIKGALWEIHSNSEFFFLYISITE